MTQLAWTRLRVVWRNRAGVCACHVAVTNCFVCVLLLLTDVSALVQRATALQSYRALAACRKATLNVVATRLSGGSFQLSDVGKLEDLLALLKLTAAADDGKGYLNEGRLWGLVGETDMVWYGSSHRGCQPEVRRRHVSGLGHCVSAVQGRPPWCH